MIWLIFALFKPYTGGCAADGDLLVRGLCQSPDVRRVVVVTEYVREQLWSSNGKLTLMRLLPRRDSRDLNGPVRRAITFALEHSILLALLLFIGIFRRRDVIHFHSRLIYPWTALAVRLLHSRALADVRDNFASRWSVNSFPLTAYVSHQIGESLQRHIAQHKLSYVPVPIDRSELQQARRQTPVLQVGQPYFLFVGAIEAGKGIPELLEAYREYRRIHGCASPALVLVGQNRLQRDRLTRHIDPRRIAGVRSVGPLAREEVYPLMLGADRLLLPSRSEGLPRVCLEAMSLNVPVVVPPRIAEFERYCPASVLAEVSPAAILDMLERPRESLIATGYPLNQHHWLATIGSYLGIYRKLAA